MYKPYKPYKYIYISICRIMYLYHYQLITFQHLNRPGTQDTQQDEARTHGIGAMMPSLRTRMENGENLRVFFDRKRCGKPFENRFFDGKRYGKPIENRFFDGKRCGKPFENPWFC